MEIREKKEGKTKALQRTR